MIASLYICNSKDFSSMNLKAFVLKMTAFIILFIIADQIAGYCFSSLYKNAGDKFERENYMRNDMKADVLIMGSSKAAHHYIPSILEDSLKLSVYNCGQRGNGVIYTYGRLATIYQRYIPQIIILDVFKGYDLEMNDNTRYLDFLKADYGHNIIVDSLFYALDNRSKYKMMLKSYQYNSTICDLLINTVIKNRARFQKDGYFPLVGAASSFSPSSTASFRSKPNSEDSTIDIDSVKISYLQRIVREKRGDCCLIFTISPTYMYINPESYAIVHDICSENHIPLFDYMNDSLFLGRYDLFYDGSHLNDKGSRLYSSIVAHDIKRYLGDIGAKVNIEK